MNMSQIRYRALLLFAMLPWIAVPVAYTQTAVVSIADAVIEVGEEKTLYIDLGESAGVDSVSLDPSSISAFQFGLQIDPTYIEVVEITTKETLAADWAIERNLVSSNPGADVYMVAAASADGLTTFGPVLAVSIRGKTSGISSIELLDPVLNTGDVPVIKRDAKVEVVRSVPISFTTEGITLAELGTIDVVVPVGDSSLASRALTSLEIEVFYDADVLDVQDVSLAGGVFDGGLVSFNEINPGRLLVAVAAADVVNEPDGKLFSMQVLGRRIGTTNINARNVRFNDAPYGNADVRVASVAVEGGTTPVVSMTRAQVSPGNPVSLGVALYNPNATPVTSFDATYTYDSAIVSFDGVDATGKALDGFAFEVVPVGDGQGKSTLVSVVVKGSGEARTPNGELYDLSFEAIDFGAIAVTPSSIVVNDDPNLVGAVVSAPVEVVDQSQLSIGFAAFSAMGQDESIEVSWMTAPGIEHLSSIVHVRHVQSGETRRFVVPPSGYARVTPEFVGELAISMEAVRADGQLDWSEEVVVSTFDETPLQLLPPYPNPARGNVRSAITVATTQDVRVVLFDMLGREVQEVYQGTVQANDFRPIEVQRAGLTPGVYFLRLSGAMHTAVKRLVIQ